MPILGRSRSMRLRKSPSEDEISQPVLTGTDAAPRKDLYMLKTTSPISGTYKTSNNATTRNNRPRTASDEARRGTQRKSAPIVAATYDHSFGTTTYSPTTYHTTEVFEDPTIGMALGSPSHAAPWNRVISTVDSASSGPSVSSGAFSDPPEKETAKGTEKISRWKSLFGRKAVLSPPNTPFYQVQRQPTPIGRTDSDQPRHVIVPKLDSTTGSKDRKLINTALYFPLPAEVQRGKTVKKSPYKEEWSPKPPPKDSVSSPQVPKVTINSPTSTNTTPTTSKSPGMMLDIDIPKSEMERYSVMFSNVLRPEQSLSLLARRKGNNGEMLKPLDEFTVNTQSANSRLLKPTRRATSPSYKSPSFTVSLFPPHDPRSTRSRTPRSAHEPTPPPSLQRSFTEPAISPNRATFSGNPHSKLSSRTPPSGFTFDIQEMASSPVELSAEDTILASPSASVSQKPKFDEPSWSPARPRKESTASPVSVSPQTIVPKTKIAAVSSSPRVASPLSSLPTKPTIEALKSSPPRVTSSPLRESAKDTETNADSFSKRDDAERNKDGTVHVAIARQVSVSRTRPKLEANERLVERKGMTPRVVKLEVAKRKSHRVQIVEG